MPYPDKLLAHDEEVVQHLHPHWLTIPAHKAYGERGAGGVIKPGETLVFVVDLVGVR